MTNYPNPSVDPNVPARSRITPRLFLRSLDFSDLLVVIGLALIIVAAATVHKAVALGLLGLILTLVGVRIDQAPR